MLIRKKSLFFFGLPLVVLPILSLASCASISQYGTNVKIIFDANDPFAGTDLVKPNKFSYNSLSGDFYNNEVAYNLSDNIESRRFFAYLESSRLFVDKLVTASHYDKLLTTLGSTSSIFVPDATQLPTTEQVTQDQLDEFMLASANILNQGDDGDLKFGINEINIEKMPTTSGIFNLVSVDPEVNPAPTPTKLTLLNKEQKTLVTTETATGFNLSFNFTYYDASSTDVFTNQINDINVVKNYLGKDSVWGKVIPTVLNWKVSLPLETKFRAIYRSTRKEIETAIDNATFDYDKKLDTFSDIEFYITTPKSLSSSTTNPFLFSFQESSPPVFENRLDKFNKWLADLSTYTTQIKLKEFSNTLTLSAIKPPPVTPPTP